ncbi:hypothetical protein THRCLA_11259 [Thraustotheca clavata]|uniref:Uncharacterized protein n=1 Tax=Thraustotheca clavata TaxID=74557 RepID=A0A1V9Y8C8_9STRA|nr:hypothetical protein THRCLA_11259 [Thraustotheca clavata]
MPDALVREVVTIPEHISELIENNLLQEALDIAQQAVRLQPNDGQKCYVLGRVYYVMKNYSKAVKSFKKAIELGYSESWVEEDLAQARVDVFNELEAQAPLEETTPEPPREENLQLQNTPGSPVIQDVIVQTNSSKILPQKIASRGIAAFFGHLSRHSSPFQQGIVFLILGLMSILRQNWHFVLIACILIFSLRSVVLSNVDKFMRGRVSLLALARLPWILYAIPLILRVVGQVKLFLLIHQSWQLTVIITIMCTFGKNSRMRKGLLNAGVFGYFVIWKNDRDQLYRFFAPLALDLAGYFLTQIPSNDVREAAKAGVQSLSQVVEEASIGMRDIVGVVNWALEYWQQPTTFSYQDIVASIKSFQRTTISWFRPQIRDYHGNTDSERLVAYLGALLIAIQPPKWIAWTMTWFRDCTSIVVVVILLIRGIRPIAMLPFVFERLIDAIDLTKAWLECGKECDSIDWILLKSPALRVWTNIKAAHYCLECSIHASQALAAASAAATIANKLRGLITAITHVHQDGVEHWSSVTDALFSIYASRDSIHDVWSRRCIIFPSFQVKMLKHSSFKDYSVVFEQERQALVKDLETMRMQLVRKEEQHKKASAISSQQMVALKKELAEMTSQRSLIEKESELYQQKCNDLTTLLETSYDQHEEDQLKIVKLTENMKRLKKKFDDGVEMVKKEANVSVMNSHEERKSLKANTERLRCKLNTERKEWLDTKQHLLDKCEEFKTHVECLERELREARLREKSQKMHTEQLQAEIRHLKHDVMSYQQEIQIQKLSIDKYKAEICRVVEDTRIKVERDTSITERLFMAQEDSFMALRSKSQFLSENIGLKQQIFELLLKRKQDRAQSTMLTEELGEFKRESRRMSVVQQDEATKQMKMLEIDHQKKIQQLQHTYENEKNQVEQEAHRRLTLLESSKNVQLEEAKAHEMELLESTKIKLEQEKQSVVHQLQQLCEAGQTELQIAQKERESLELELRELRQILEQHRDKEKKLIHINGIRITSYNVCYTKLLRAVTMCFGTTALDRASSRTV